MKNRIFIYFSILSLLITHTAIAAPIVSDSFNTDGALNNRIADSGQTWSANAGWTTSVGNAVYDGGGNGMAGITLAPNYFANNPGIYQLEATVSISTTGTEWIAIGFSQNIETPDGNGHFQSDEDGGRPWLLLRGNGATFLRSDGNTGDITPGGTFPTSNSTLKLIYDTSVPNWTFDAYINGTQLDLNGATAGNTFTYSTNPTAIRSVGLTGNNLVSGSVHDFSLSAIPEPSSLLLLATALGALGLFKRRCG